MTAKGKVLIVDDSGSLKSVHHILQQEKYEIKHAPSAEEALDLLENWEADLVVSSFKLCGMSGADLLCELHEWDGTLPVILVGEGGEEKDWKEALQGEAAALFPKGVNKEAFLKAVHKAIQKKEKLSV